MQGELLPVTFPSSDEHVGVCLSIFAAAACTCGGKTNMEMLFVMHPSLFAKPWKQLFAVPKTKKEIPKISWGAEFCGIGTAQGPFHGPLT